MNQQTQHDASHSDDALASSMLFQAQQESPEKPSVKTCVVDRKAALQYLPSFEDHQNTLYNACTHGNVNCNQSAIFLYADEVGANKYHGAGPILIANIPDYLSPYLTELAAKQPSILNINSLDLKSTASLLIWSVRDNDDRRNLIAVDAGILPWLLTSNDSSNADELSFARIVFCADEKVAFGGFWFDEDDIAEAQAAGICSQSYIDYPDEVFAAAKKKAEAAGSPDPWYGNPWLDDDGSVLMQLPCCSRA
jgi:hypothetical protein